MHVVVRVGVVHLGIRWRIVKPAVSFFEGVGLQRSFRSCRTDSSFLRRSGIRVTVAATIAVTVPRSRSVARSSAIFSV